mmetsp:Transcript_13853/g.45544  ORF Transcript_13853/g.45544 Transcript_13853/m.45544 type:complete len:225 (-) Transcript_13853:4982-5656(-)
MRLSRGKSSIARRRDGSHMSGGVDGGHARYLFTGHSHGVPIERHESVVRLAHLQQVWGGLAGAGVVLDDAQVSHRHQAGLSDGGEWYAAGVMCRRRRGEARDCELVCDGRHLEPVGLDGVVARATEAHRAPVVAQGYDANRTAPRHPARRGDCMEPNLRALRRAQHVLLWNSLFLCAPHPVDGVFARDGAPDCAEARDDGERGERGASLDFGAGAAPGGADAAL